MAKQPTFAVHVSLTVSPKSVHLNLAERLLSIRHYTVIRDNPVVAYGRRNNPIASQFLVMRCPPASPISPPGNGLSTLNACWKLLI